MEEKGLHVPCQLPLAGQPQAGQEEYGRQPQQNLFSLPLPSLLQYQFEIAPPQGATSAIGPLPAADSKLDKV